MKKIKYVLMMIFAALSIFGCSCNKKDDSSIKYTHYLRGGGSESLDAKILWEYSTSAYTKYQVAYTSYVCSDPSVNYVNVIYIEITNKDTKADALIRNISVSTIEENGNISNVGLWGDDKEALSKEFYSGIESQLLAKLKYAKYDFVKDIASKGYGNYKNIDGIGADLISGGTVSASNIVSIVKAIFDYHIDNYY